MASIGDTTRPAFAYDSATDTWVPVGVGPHSHTPAAIGAISSSLVTTKGDLIVATGSGTVVRQGVGADGSMLVADSTSADGVSWAGPLFLAGKNKIINGDFAISQRGTTFNSVSNGTYTMDRWFITNPSNVNVTQQTFTPGTAPVAGYEATSFLRFAKSTTAVSYDAVNTRIEDVRTLAGQTATLSFWAKASISATVNINLEQNFGSGGSSAVGISQASYNLTTSWQRFTFTVSIPSLSGKTIGTSSFLNLQVFFIAPGLPAITIDVWGVQLEAGSVATPFQTATGTLQQELAACQRYYWRSGGNIVYQRYGNGSARSTNQVDIVVNFPSTMRTTPTSLDYSNIAVYDGSTITATTAISLDQTSPMFGGLLVTVASGLTQFRPYSLLSNNTISAYLGFNAEL